MNIQCYSSGEYYYFTDGVKYFLSKILSNSIIKILEKDLSNMERIDFNSLKEEKRNLVIEKFLQ